MKRKAAMVVLLGLVLAGCGSDGVDIGPTIADLENLPPLIESVELEPRASFEIDRQQVIDSFRALVEITADGGGTGDELRRLADLELESSLDNRLSDDTATRKRGIEEALRAIGIYEAYLEKYPDRADNDMILYQLSRAYALESEPGKSLAVLDRIAREYPASRYIDEVQFRRGEILFVAREYEAAARAYGAIVSSHRQSLFYEKAIYKYGWTQFKLSRFREALGSFVRLLDINRERRNIEEIGFNASLPRARVELLEDVVRVVSLSFSYQEDKLYIARYFNKTGKRDYEPLLYRKLGELYLEKNRIVDGSNLFMAYTSAYPNSAHTPYFHQRAIDIYQQAGYADLVLREKINFVNRYDVGTEYWALQNHEARQQLKPALALHLSELATHYHARARVSKKSADYRVTADWYRRFLKSFPDDAAAPRQNFLLAESLYDARQYPPAIDEYEKTAYAYTPHRDSAEAGYAALIAFDAMFKTTNASEIPALRRKRIKSAVRFTTTFADDPRIPAVELQSAQQFYAWKDYPEAMASATRLLENKRIDTLARRTAWTILSDAQFSTGDYAAAEHSYLALLGQLPKKDAGRKAVREQVAASIYKQGEQSRDGADHAAAALHFTRLGQIIPESAKRIIADYDAATAYVQLEDWPATITQLEAFRKRYPRDQKWKAGVTEKLALAYSKSGKQTLAAREMIALSTLAGSGERGRDLMWRAAEIYQQAGESGQAIATYKNYVAVYPYPLARSIELRHKIAEYYRGRNDSRNLRHWLNEIVHADARGKAERNDRSRYLAANASLELVRPLHRSYKKSKLTVPLKTSLGKKKKLMQQSIDAYRKVLQYQVQEVTTEATFQIAEIYHDFARSLMNSQRPRGLNDEQLEEYDLLLEEQAFPFEEKAIEIHLTNFKRIPAGTYDEPTRKSLKVLGELMPYRFAKVESTDAYVAFQ